MPNQSLTRTFDRIFTIALEQLQTNVLFDNVSARIAALFRMRDMGAIVPKKSSPNISNMVLKELPAAQGYSDLDTLNIVRADPYTRAIYEWKQVAAPNLNWGLSV